MLESEASGEASAPPSLADEVSSERLLEWMDLEEIRVQRWLKRRLLDDDATDQAK